VCPESKPGFKPRKMNQPVFNHQFSETKIMRAIDVNSVALGDLQHAMRHFEVTWSFRNIKRH
jgi:hypothetical protein